MSATVPPPSLSLFGNRIHITATQELSRLQVKVSGSHAAAVGRDGCCKKTLILQSRKLIAKKLLYLLVESVPIVSLL
jgi:hypothetical protein